MIEGSDAVRQRAKAARIVHDAVTGDLSTIARIAQRQMRLSESDREREAWAQINSRSIRVLDSVHAVIRQLGTLENGEDERGGDGQAGSSVADGRRFVEAIRDTTREWDDCLAQSGFHGNSRIIDHTHGPHRDDPEDVQEREACVLDVLDEAYANIVRHGDPGGDAFSVAVTVGDSRIEIVAVNPMAGADKRDGETGLADAMPSFPGGHGLAMHRDEVERLGGMLSVEAEDGQWMLYARVPRVVDAR